jgi:hypothetical protein
VSRLPSAALSNILTPIVSSLTVDEPLPPSVIPVSAEGWRSALSDAGLLVNRNGPLESEAAAVREAADSGDAAQLRRSAKFLALAAQKIVADLRLMSAFTRRPGLEVQLLRVALARFAVVTLNAIIGSISPEELAESIDDLQITLRRLHALSGFPTDPCLEAFGFPREAICDERGIFSSSRLLGNFTGGTRNFMKSCRKCYPPSRLPSGHLGCGVSSLGAYQQSAPTGDPARRYQCAGPDTGRLPVVRRQSIGEATSRVQARR